MKFYITLSFRAKDSSLILLESIEVEVDKDFNFDFECNDEYLKIVPYMFETKELKKCSHCIGERMFAGFKKIYLKMEGDSNDTKSNIKKIHAERVESFSDEK